MYTYISTYVLTYVYTFPSQTYVCTYFGAPALQLLLLLLLRLLLQSPIATASLQQFLAVAVAYKRAIISGMHNIASFFSTLLSDLPTDPDQES